MFGGTVVARMLGGLKPLPEEFSIACPTALSREWTHREWCALGLLKMFFIPVSDGFIDLGWFSDCFPSRSLRYEDMREPALLSWF